MLRITGAGLYNVTTPCKVPRVPANAATNDFFYCNGFDGNELPLAIASVNGESGFWIAGGEEPTSTFGIRCVQRRQGCSSRQGARRRAACGRAQPRLAERVGAGVWRTRASPA
jgi:hypothetical protein